MHRNFDFCWECMCGDVRSARAIWRPRRPGRRRQPRQQRSQRPLRRQEVAWETSGVGFAFLSPPGNLECAMRFCKKVTQKGAQYFAAFLEFAGGPGPETSSLTRGPSCFSPSRDRNSPLPLSLLFRLF